MSESAPDSSVEATKRPVATGAADVFGLVLAGGRSRRMPGGPKALQDLAGKPMVLWPLERLAPQVGSLALAVGAGLDGLEQHHLPCLYDAVPSFRGPLAGLQAGLRELADTGRAQTEQETSTWLQLSPCDAPFLPETLVERLQAANDGHAQVLVPCTDGQLQPTFAAWRADTLPAVEEALAERGGFGLLDVLQRLPFEAVDWPAVEGDGPPPFFNVNDASDLALATRWLEPAP